MARITLRKNKAIRKRNTGGKHRKKKTKSLEIERIKPSGMSSFRNSRRWTSIVNCSEIPLKFPSHFFFFFFSLSLNCMTARFPFRELIKLSNNSMQGFKLWKCESSAPMNSLSSQLDVYLWYGRVREKNFRDRRKIFYFEIMWCFRCF